MPLYRAPPQHAQARSRGSVGHTRRPQGTGGAGTRNLNVGQWAALKYVGYNSSQLPPIDRPPTDGPATLPLLNDAGTGCDHPEQFVVSVIAAELVLVDPLGQIIPARSVVASAGIGVSELQCRVEWGLGAGLNNRVDLDVGAGFQFSCCAQVVHVSLIVPAGVQDFEARQGQPMAGGPVDPVTGFQNAIHAAIVYATVNRSPAYLHQEWQLTRGLLVPAGATTRVAIPAGADFVEGMELSAPAAATPFLNFVTAEQQAGVFNDVGQYSTSTTPRRFARTRIPGNARFIQSGAVVPGAQRLFLLPFTSRP